MVNGDDSYNGGRLARFRILIRDFVGTVLRFDEANQSSEPQQEMDSNGGDEYSKSYRDVRERRQNKSDFQTVSTQMDDSNHSSEIDTGTEDAPEGKSDESHTNEESPSTEISDDHDNSEESHSTTEKTEEHSQERATSTEGEPSRGPKYSLGDTTVGSDVSVTGSDDQTGEATAGDNVDSTQINDDDGEAVTTEAEKKSSDKISKSVPDSDRRDDTKKQDKSRAQTEGDVSGECDSKDSDTKEIDDESDSSDKDEAPEAAIRRIDSPEAELTKPIDSVPTERLLPQSAYITELEEQIRVLKTIINERETTIADQKETLADLRSQLTDLETTEPGLESIQQDEISTSKYINILENHIEDIQSKVDRKNRVIEELKGELEEAESEVYREAVQEVIAEFVSDVRAPLARGLRQGNSGTEGVNITIDQFDDLVADHGLSLINPSPGDPIDRSRAEVVQTLPSDYEEGAVTKVYERGLEDDGSVVKHATVAMSEGPSKDVDTADEDEAAGDENENDSGDQNAGKPEETADDTSVDVTTGTNNTSDADTHDTETDLEEK